MKVIVDSKIPYIEGIIEKLADEVVYIQGSEIKAQDVKDADAMFIRTRTRCDRQLLEGSKVKLIITATIGFDHIDTAYCREAGIVWENCPGCNAGAVEQYVHSSLSLLRQEKGIDLRNACLGIVGVGHVGSRIAAMAQRIGMRVLLNDPPRADRGEQGFTDLHTLTEMCHIITFHTPLTNEGIYRTYHLADNNFFHSLKCKPYIINTSRGEIVCTQALLAALEQHNISGAIIDTWEHEPNIDRELLHKAFIGTPHIAGYSIEGKINATRMALETFCKFFRITPDFALAFPENCQHVFEKDDDKKQLLSYNPLDDCKTLRAHPELFEQIRSNYAFRHE